MSTGTPRQPYEVMDQTHAVTFRPGGQTGGQWTVTIRHGDNITSQFTVPEEAYTADTVHALAMQQVRAAQAVANLPDSASAQAKAEG